MPLAKNQKNLKEGISVKRSVKAAKPGDFLESLFVETLQPEVPLDPDSAPPPGTTARTYEDLEILKLMVSSQKEPASLSWNFLVSSFGPKALPSAPSRSLPASFKPVAGTLLKRLKEEKIDNPTLGTLPSVADICQIYAYLHVFKQETWDNLVVDLLESISTCTSAEARETLATELLEAWRVLGRIGFRENNIKPSGRRDWDFLLLPSSQQRTEMPKEKAAKGVLLGFLSGLSPHVNHRKSVIGLVTFAVFSDCSVVDFGGAYKNSRFMELLRARISHYSSDIERLRSVPLHEFPPFHAKILENLSIDWSKVATAARFTPTAGKLASNLADDVQAEDAAPTAFGKRSLQLGLGNTRRKLADALKRRDVIAIDKLWQEARQRSTAELCNQFILSYSTLRHPNSAIDVWNHMIEASIQPTLATWNAMLEGCKASRSPAALEGVWAKMIASGAQPDDVCWTTRIHGLADCGRTREAVEALEEMGRNWIHATKKAKVKDLQNTGDVNGVVKPNTSVVNAAVHGLVRHGKNQDANNVLIWAAQLGINPDLITFNILLKPLVKEGRTDTVQALLKHMQSLGIHADTTTFTTILDEVIRDESNPSPVEKTRAITDLLDQMAAAGLPANLHIYGKIIGNILNSASTVDLSTVQAILARMTTEGVEPTMYIYTMLITHHFSRDPPDIEAARALAEHVSLNKKVVDHVFWDRMIEGYSRAGYSSAALAVMGRVDRDGNRVGWQAMTELLRALVQTGEDETAKQVVQSVKIDRGGPLSRNVRGADGQHEFWDVVAEYDLLGES